VLFFRYVQRKTGAANASPATFLRGPLRLTSLGPLRFSSNAYRKGRQGFAKGRKVNLHTAEWNTNSNSW
jgi:hypothetical protein